MAKIDVDSNDDVLLADVNRYLDLFYKLGKSSAEQTELSGLQSTLADYLLIASDYNDLVTQQNTNTSDIGTNETNLDIVRTAKDTTGSANTYSVNTDGTFDLTKNGNMLPMNPNVANTGASTVDPDGQGAKSIKKWDADTTAYVDVEEGDILQNVHLTLRWDVSEDFFVLAPSVGGLDVTEWFNGVPVVGYSPVFSGSGTDLSVTGSGWSMGFASIDNNLARINLIIDGSYVIGSSSESLNIQSGFPLKARFESSLTHGQAGSLCAFAYKEGDNYEDATLSIYNGTGGTQTVSVIRAVTGSGRIEAFGNVFLEDNLRYAVKLEIDGTIYYYNNIYGTLYIDMPYETGFVFSVESGYSDTDSYYIGYIED